MTFQLASAAKLVGLSQALGPPLLAIQTSALIWRMNRPGLLSDSSDKPARAQKVVAGSNKAES